MSLRARESESRVTADLIAEAAAWIAILHGPNRSREAERGFRRWIAKSPCNAHAFEEATAIWEEAKNLPRPRAYRTDPVGRGNNRMQLIIAAAASVLLTLAAVAWYYIAHAAITTDIGEQRILTLEDGTEVTLNTATRIVQHYDKTARRITLTTGEALFEVAKRPNWPFIVEVGGQRVRAIGTTFTVRRDEKQTTVTLVEGKVAISSGASASTDHPATTQGAAAVVLAPGQRITIADDAAPRLDEPELPKVLAWQRREVALDDATLGTAIAEMNRYSRRKLECAEEGSGSAAPAPCATIRVTGLFRAGDSESFARAVAEAYHLKVTVTDGVIRLE